MLWVGCVSLQPAKAAGREADGSRQRFPHVEGKQYLWDWSFARDQRRWRMAASWR